MSNKRIYLCLAHMSKAGLEQKFIQEAFDTNWVVPLGPNVNGFEKDLEEFVGQNKRVVALSAGTAAVHLALIACGVGPGDEVCVQSFTFCASSHPITYLGATPVFIDSEKDTWNMDPELLEEAIKDRIAKTGKKPKAIVPVALYGMPYRIDRIMGRSGLEKLYLRYCYELGYLPKYQQNPTKLHILLKEDLLKCDQYSEQAKLLSRYHVDTEKDLSDLMENIEGKIKELSLGRDELRQTARRVLPESEINDAKEKIKDLTAEIRELRHELKVCGDIQQRSGHVRENLAVIDRDRMRERVR